MGESDETSWQEDADPDAAGVPTPKKNDGWLKAIILIPLLAALGFFFVPMICAEQHREELMEIGLPAYGEIVSVEDTGNRYNDDIEIEATVRIEGEEPYEATATWVPGALEIHRYEEGARVEVRVSPEERTDIVIVGVVADE